MKQPTGRVYMSVPDGGWRGPTSRNEVSLIGRLGGSPVWRSLPSGDVLVAWRMIVDRAGRPSDARRVVDTLACVTFDPEVCQQAETWQTGDILEARGSIRRRFWRVASGPVSRYEIEVVHARRVAGALARGAQSAGGERTEH